MDDGPMCCSCPVSVGRIDNRAECEANCDNGRTLCTAAESQFCVSVPCGFAQSEARFQTPPPMAPPRRPLPPVQPSVTDPGVHMCCSCPISIGRIDNRDECEALCDNGRTTCNAAEGAYCVPTPCDPRTGLPFAGSRDPSPQPPRHADVVAPTAPVAPSAACAELYLGSGLPWETCTGASGQCLADRQMDNGRINIHGETYDRGLFMGASANAAFMLGRRYQTLSGCVGISRDSRQPDCSGVARFRISRDHQILRDWEVKTAADAASCFEIDVTDVDYLVLETESPPDGQRCSLAAIADAKVSQCQ